MEHTFRYKLDFYYQQTLMYVGTLIAYVLVRGSFVENQFTFFYRDPLFYIIGLFVLMSIIVLVLNRLRDRRLIIIDDVVIFRSRKRELRINVSDIEWMHVGKERLVQTAGRFQLIVLKMKGRRRLFRIRVGRYERGHELVEAMETIAGHVPKRKRRQLGMRRRKRV